jgi:anti-anti-sigma factor
MGSRLGSERTLDAWISMLDLDNRTPPPNRVELTSAARDIAVVALIGEHDLGHYESLKAALAGAAVRAPNVVVDLSECAFIDSNTIPLLLHSQDVLSEASGSFAVVIDPEPGPVSRLAELVRLDEMLVVHPSLERAITSLHTT